MNKKYFVELSKEECLELNGGISQGSVFEEIWDKLKNWLFGK